MNKFFVSDEVYKDRLDICKGCDYYFDLQVVAKFVCVLCQSRHVLV